MRRFDVGLLATVVIAGIPLSLPIQKIVSSYRNSNKANLEAIIKEMKADGDSIVFCSDYNFSDQSFIIGPESDYKPSKSHHYFRTGQQILNIVSDGTNFYYVTCYNYNVSGRGRAVFYNVWSFNPEKNETKLLLNSSNLAVSSNYICDLRMDGDKLYLRLDSNCFSFNKDGSSLKEVAKLKGKDTAICSSGKHELTISWGEVLVRSGNKCARVGVGYKTSWVRK